ncbi:putative transport protein [Staphylococcus simiae CCM 7213 = CCUG 51256]|uniref:Putative transport protein n=1 Tax=Staphylococcus simiae CCM 7213 = CCUG 51256 TaxID=911238 RepID=G5JF22_9STAP|nr:putative transport protein [Staphylococcus simiae CCM 7213 = CCUG 51256]SNV77890.1 multidrug transporter [Staphylococcus simiae]
MKLKSIITVFALILIMFMAAIETSIISLAMPTIKQDLHAGKFISLIFTAYFIALVIANPIVGELLNRFKIIYIAIIGILLFSIGSLMSGLSINFHMLVIARVIQGFGAGVMMSLSQIVPKLAFEIPLRYKIMGIVGSVWGISSIVGPLLGGGILEFATWHWLFFINIPIAVIAIILVIITFHFPNEKLQIKLSLILKV